MARERIQTTFRVDPDLLKRFRHALLERETKMTPVIEKLILQWLQGYEFKESQELAGEYLPEQPIAERATESNPPKRINAPATSAVSGTQTSDSDSINSPVEAEKNSAEDDADLPQRNVRYVETQSDVSSSGALAQEGPSPGQRAFDFDVAMQLNPRYKFESFVIGNGNCFAHAACQAVAERPSKAYNPLFLYSGVGLGKTHLMQAIGHEIERRQPTAAIRYMSAEKFTNELIKSLRSDKMSDFRERLRNADVLLIDDVQFLAQKERTQEEFFHTFNALHELQKQIVIASDRPPKELGEIEDRLRNRFEWGLVADIQSPDLETKVAILQKKAELENVTLPTDVALYIASNLPSNIRELEGALIRLVAHSLLTRTTITLPYAQQVLKNFIDSQNRRVTIEDVQKAVAQQFGLRLVEIKARNNSRAIVYPRQIAMYLARFLTPASLPEIGRQFGGKHSTTVLRSVEKIDEIRRHDKDLNRLVNKLTEQLGG